ncbi:DUF1134 domain-containing protein [Parerythrobacter aestuarii]|uniref:DUF1134 domain-containing protein n=1 Tax=Parerythrobacter aestuarii TaxID=3020909 RepID=UPI0024DE0A6C|nr:EipA family protein [Parerythrobacter aestuarii]
MTTLMRTIRSTFAAVATCAALAAAPLAAQAVETIDPDTAIDGDLVEQPGDQPVYSDAPATGVASPAGPSIEFTPTPPADAPAEAGVAPSWSDPGVVESWTGESLGEEAGTDVPAAPQASATTYGEDDLIGAAEGVFGKGAEGLAKMIQKLLKEQGEPNAYIVGREAGGAFIVGARYGSGKLYHKVEGERPVYWTGPSIGFDAGANAGNTFVLVYNLYDTEELYERYPAGEGQAYLIGGLNASYMRKGDVVLIPIRVGAGLRLGVNAGYMKFSKKQRWLPF